MKETPITDANERLVYSEGNYGMGEAYAERVVDSDVCRKLECDRAALLEACKEFVRKVEGVKNGNRQNNAEQIEPFPSRVDKDGFFRPERGGPDSIRLVIPYP